MNSHSTRPFPTAWPVRLAREADIPALENLIPASARALLRSVYSVAQIEAALGPVFGVDRQLIRDGTCFVAESGAQIVGCGGWSRRRSRFGGDQSRMEPDPELDPCRDAARIRAFFVHPDWARRGVGRSLMTACERAIQASGFSQVEMVATLSGEPLYLAFGYTVIERYALSLAPDMGLPVVRMGKTLA